MAKIVKYFRKDFWLRPRHASEIIAQDLRRTDSNISDGS